jgi:serine protease inhibitor
MRYAIPFYVRSPALLILACAVLLSACGGSGGGSTMASNPGGGGPGSAATPPAVTQAQKAGTPTDPALISADNAFGLNLLNALLASNSGNVAISPTSLNMALQILYNGAAGSTAQAMSQTLQLQGFSLATLNSDNAALEASLLNPDPAVQITLANSLWMHLSDNPVLPSFTQLNQTYYGAEIGDLSGAPANVNAWVANITNGLITNILPPANYNLVVAVIANAIYFKGAWTVAFDPTLTEPAPFTEADGTQVTVQMMYQMGTFPTYTGSNYEVVRIPYGQTQRLSMWIVLPNAGVNLNAFVATLSPAMFDSWASELQGSYVNLGLPRFSTTFGASLPVPLTTLGMGIAFSQSQADFSALAPNTYVSDVEHQTVVEVDESGTVAAGATTVTVSPTVVGEAAPPLLIDHPFFYAIRDDQSGALLFIGTMVNPN